MQKSLISLQEKKFQDFIQTPEFKSFFEKPTQPSETQQKAQEKLIAKENVIQTLEAQATALKNANSDPRIICKVLRTLQDNLNQSAMLAANANDFSKQNQFINQSKQVEQKIIAEQKTQPLYVAKELLLSAENSLHKAIEKKDKVSLS